MKRIFNAMLCLGVTLSAAAKTTGTAIFYPTFKSLQVLDPSNKIGHPIIRGDKQLKISFDELAEDNRYLRYRIVHCNSDWQPSQLVESEFIDGFNEAQIDDYRLSENTLAHYVHYDLMLPNPDMQPLVSGNYIVEIFDEEDPSTTLLQAGFLVDEGVAGLDMAVTSRTDVDYNRNHQQLSVKADLSGARIDNPYNDLILVVVQNGDFNSARALKHPLSVNAESAVYEHQKELIFRAGNEFRRFDIANVNYPGMGVDRISYTGPFYSALLKVDEPRAAGRYVYDQDQNGRFYPAEIYSDDADISADYVETYFTLTMPQINSEVKIEGDLTIGYDPAMVYDESLGAYIKTMLLKQGMYNYRYVSDSNNIEGDFYETGNEYLALLYYREPSGRYDRLIGSAVIYSGK